MMNHHGTLGHVIGFLSLLILSVTGIIVGLMPFNIHVLETNFVATKLHMLIMPLQVVAGVAGVIGLLYLLGMGFRRCDHHSHSHK